jgi:Prokaryotic glutathione synthetase, ATP-grasp domain.
MDFTFVTCSKLADLDPDDRLALNVLKRRGYACQGAVWDDPAIDWARAGTCVLRSTWDYHVKFEKFMQWIDDVSSKTQLINQPHLIRWSVRKTYLRDLVELGVPVTPTHWLTDASEESISAAAEAFAGTEKVVIKPTIGLATSGVKMVAREEIATIKDHIEKQLKLGEVMVQPYLSSVHDYGERSLMFLGGTYSHAVRKSAFQHMATAGGAGERAITADDVEIETAIATMKALPMVPALKSLNTTLEQIAYARVDLVRDESHNPVVLEVELVEPSLFLGYDDMAAEKFATILEKSMKNAVGHK